MPDAPKTVFGKVYAGKKILVTGHTGFKGAWLSEWLLLLGAQVSGFSIDCEEQSLFNQLQLATRMSDRRGDVRDLRALSDTIASIKPDFIFHLAAQPLVRHSYVDPVGTFTTNVTGSVNVMEAVRLSSLRCALVMITTDKCYENREAQYAYRESDPLGGHDPYSASKAAAEIAIDSYRKSFFSAATSHVALASARSGNVIGGGDWAQDRLVPDSMRALQRGETIPVRNKNATRPWQHVLDPLSGYLALGVALWEVLEEKKAKRAAEVCSAFNFGPDPESNRSVQQVVDEVLKHWPGKWIDKSDPNAPHEAGLLNLKIDKAAHVFGWRPVWDFDTAVAKTIAWYRHGLEKKDVDLAKFTRDQICEYVGYASADGLNWAQ
ncbi:MAG: CDP-glucose 4,6-dehydratase [Verrucomicrobiota bacterium]|jgi:CDP-glucose 4,6-dehydratase